MDDTLRQALALSANQIKSGMLQQMTGVKLTPEQEKSMGEFQDKVTALVSGALSWEKLKPAYVKLYAEAYTEQASAIVEKQLAEAMLEIQKLIRDFRKPTCAYRNLMWRELQLAASASADVSRCWNRRGRLKSALPTPPLGGSSGL